MTNRTGSKTYRIHMSKEEEEEEEEEEELGTKNKNHS